MEDPVESESMDTDNTLKTPEAMAEELESLQRKTAERDKQRLEFRRIWAALLRPDCDPGIDDSRVGESGLSVEEKILSEKTRVKQLETAIADDQLASSVNNQAFIDIEREAARERKKSKRESKKRKKESMKRKRLEKAANKKASKSGGDDDDNDDDDDDGGYDSESSSEFESDDSCSMTGESYHKACVKAVKNKKKIIKKEIGEWLKPFMGPAGGPPHEDEEAARLFKMHVKCNVSPDEVLPLVEKMAALVGPLREGFKESLDRVYAGLLPHIEELDLDMSDLSFPDGFHDAPKTQYPSHKWS